MRLKFKLSSEPVPTAEQRKQSAKPDPPAGQQAKSLAPLSDARTDEKNGNWDMLSLYTGKPRKNSTYGAKSSSLPNLLIGDADVEGADKLSALNTGLTVKTKTSKRMSRNSPFFRPVSFAVEPIFPSNPPDKPDQPSEADPNQRIASCTSDFYMMKLYDSITDLASMAESESDLPETTAGRKGDEDEEISPTVELISFYESLTTASSPVAPSAPAKMPLPSESEDLSTFTPKAHDPSKFLVNMSLDEATPIAHGPPLLTRVEPAALPLHTAPVSHGPPAPTEAAKSSGPYVAKVPFSASTESLGMVSIASSVQDVGLSHCSPGVSLNELGEKVPRPRTESDKSNRSAIREKRGDKISLGPFIVSGDKSKYLLYTVSGALFELLDIVNKDASLIEVEMPDGYDLETPDPEPVMMTEDGKTVVKEATLPALCALLSAEGVIDASFVADFLATYRYFAEPLDIARLLILRYIVIGEQIAHRIVQERRATLMGEPTKATTPAWDTFQQLRILNVFKKWIEYHPRDFEQNTALIRILIRFLEDHVKKDSKRAVFADALLGNLRDKVGLGVEIAPSDPAGLPRMRTIKSEPALNTPSASSSLSSPSHLNPPTGESYGDAPDVGSYVSVSSMDLSPILGQIPNEVPRPLAIQRAPKFSTWQFRPEDLAAQITLIEHRNFTSIKMHEFHHQAWTSKLKTKLAPNLVNFIDFFNRIAYGVASELVSEPKIKTRVTLLKRWIFVAHQCLKLRNYNTVFEIVAGLNMGCVSRLKKTWKALSKKYWDVWEMLNHVVSNEGSYRWYRSQIAEVVRSNSTGGIPCVPYLGVNLSDLTFAEDGNPTFAKPSVALEAEPLAKVAGAAPPPTPIVNFNKFRFISQLINKIEFMQRYEYTLPPDPKIQDFILHEWGNLTEAELYTASKVCEPRIAGT